MKTLVGFIIEHCKEVWSGYKQECPDQNCIQED